MAQYQDEKAFKDPYCCLNATRVNRRALFGGYQPVRGELGSPYFHVPCAMHDMRRTVSSLALSSSGHGVDDGDCISRSHSSRCPCLHSTPLSVRSACAPGHISLCACLLNGWICTSMSAPSECMVCLCAALPRSHARTGCSLANSPPSRPFSRSRRARARRHSHSICMGWRAR